MENLQQYYVVVKRKKKLKHGIGESKKKSYRTNFMGFLVFISLSWGLMRDDVACFSMVYRDYVDPTKRISLVCLGVYTY